MDADKKPTTDNSIDSLEGTSTVVEPTNTSTDDAVEGGSKPTVKGPELKPKRNRRLKGLTKRFNVYLLLFVLVILIAIISIVVAVMKNHKTNNATTINAQNLTQQQLEQLATSDVSVGNNKQILNVQSNAVFAGQVLVRSDLEVAGTLKIGGALNLPGITVSGTSTFSQIDTGTLTVSGNTAFQGQLTADNGVNVAGNSNFSGSVSASALTTNTLTLNGTLNIDHHIAAGGATPSRSNGSALGSGGTSSVSGSDTAGSVTVNTGTGPAAGCFITINFSTKFNSTPHVVVTPIGSSAAGMAYYVNRTTSNMSICTASAPPASTSFGFDYIVFD